MVAAHQDSINLWLPSILPAPGADDDGSGTVTILEAFRALLSDKTVQNGELQNTVEFHWYSAEEGGLLGSRAIFSEYEKQGRDVKAMLQQDMVSTNPSMRFYETIHNPWDLGENAQSPSGCLVACKQVGVESMLTTIRIDWIRTGNA